MQIRWTPEASASLEQISTRIARDNPVAALKTARTIFQQIEQLSTFPHRGRPGREEGTRELGHFFAALHRCLPREGFHGRNSTNLAWRTEQALRNPL
jgi:plasmid stabilization system protein ParE